MLTALSHQRGFYRVTLSTTLIGALWIAAALSMSPTATAQQPMGAPGGPSQQAFVTQGTPP